MCLENAVPAKADFKVKKYWKTFFLNVFGVRFGVRSVIYGMEYKKGWNYPCRDEEHISNAGIHCFDNYQDALNYKNNWGIPNEVICPVYALGSDILAVGQTDAEVGFKEFLVPSTTFRKVFIRQKDYEQIIKGESVHD